MNAVILITIISGISLQNIFQKAYNRKKNTPFIFSLFSVIAAIIFFAVNSMGRFEFSSDFLPYSIIFALSYGISILSTFFAIQCGPLALTSLISSFSLLIPTIYGLIFLKENISRFLITGIILLILSLILINYEKGEKKITLKWIIFSALAFLGNGICSTVQKVQQVNFNGAYKNETMITALLIAAVILLFFVLSYEKKELKDCFQPPVFYALLCGLSNGIVNYFVMVLSNRMDASVMFPLISSGSIVATTAVSVLFYKEKFNRIQVLGLIFGIVSIIFLNL